MEWIDILSTFGVPVAAMIGLAIYIVQKDKQIAERDDKFTNMVNHLVGEHSKEVKELQTAINNNTLVMTRLCERIGLTDENCN